METHLPVGVSDCVAGMENFENDSKSLEIVAEDVELVAITVVAAVFVITVKDLVKVNMRIISINSIIIYYPLNRDRHSNSSGLAGMKYLRDAGRQTGCGDGSA